MKPSWDNGGQRIGRNKVWEFRPWIQKDVLVARVVHLHAKGGKVSHACIGVRSIGGMEKGFTVDVCTLCEDPTCARVFSTGAAKVGRWRGSSSSNHLYRRAEGGPGIRITSLSPRSKLTAKREYGQG